MTPLPSNFNPELAQTGRFKNAREFISYLGRYHRIARQIPKSVNVRRIELGRFDHERPQKPGAELPLDASTSDTLIEIHSLFSDLEQLVLGGAVQDADFQVIGGMSNLSLLSMRGPRHGLEYSE